MNAVKLSEKEMLIYETMKRSPSGISTLNEISSLLQLTPRETSSAIFRMRSKGVVYVADDSNRRRVKYKIAPLDQPVQVRVRKTKPKKGKTLADEFDSLIERINDFCIEVENFKNKVRSYSDKVERAKRIFED
jgi:DNA-binding MarR family transcriptional regulator